MPISDVILILIALAGICIGTGKYTLFLINWEDKEALEGKKVTLFKNFSRILTGAGAVSIILATLYGSWHKAPFMMTVLSLVVVVLTFVAFSRFFYEKPEIRS